MTATTPPHDAPLPRASSGEAGTSELPSGAGSPADAVLTPDAHAGPEAAGRAGDTGDTGTRAEAGAVGEGESAGEPDTFVHAEPAGEGDALPRPDAVGGAGAAVRDHPYGAHPSRPGAESEAAGCSGDEVVRAGLVEDDEDLPRPGAGDDADGVGGAGTVVRGDPDGAPAPGPDGAAAPSGALPAAMAGGAVGVAEAPGAAEPPALPEPPVTAVGPQRAPDEAPPAAPVPVAAAPSPEDPAHADDGGEAVPPSAPPPAGDDWAFSDRPGPGPGAGTGAGDALAGRPAGAAARRGPLIVGESTHEIPVHLLFRDEVDPAVRRPTVVGRRLGTGEQPRIRRTTAPTRPEPPLDPRFTERPGPTLPGWTAACAGGLTLAGCLALLWHAGALPGFLTLLVGLAPQPYHGIGIGQWLLLTLGVLVLLFTLGGLSRGRVGHALVLTLFGEYRGSVRRTGLLWISPLLLRRRVDVRLRHWRSEPMPAMDANGTALSVVVLVVWRVRDTVRATLGIRGHEDYLREQVEAAMARVMSQLPADAFHGASPTLRNVEAVGDSLTRMLSAECRPAGIEVFSAQPTRIEYAPEIAGAMRRSRIAALDARHRDTVLSAVVDAVDDTVRRLTARGLVALDDHERRALVKDLTVAFYTGRAGDHAERL
ncbi:SPFH domain-containing protein [Streptomyces sp. NRRL F-5126]|uniref:SPFH domain-containing protein n=1 Tax=Streptomyces sp. NRRL F-5126 TaxID=1463857 RepID=UPI001EFF1D06|nr:SPFH domain-containing protein [Streptomyces sp. NRRL F-5126]